MMKYYIFILISVYLTMQDVCAQNNVAKMSLNLDIPAVSIIDFAGTENKISFNSGKGAEQIITPSTLDRTWLNYSSIVEENTTNIISVNLSAWNLPSNMAIRLKVGENMGAGAGATGKPVGQILLSKYPQQVITGIGSCYTGKGIRKGHQLTYTWEGLFPAVDADDEDASIDNIEIAVTYTITSSI